jgi:hypothetical protein
MQGTTASGDLKGTWLTNLNKPKELGREIFCYILYSVVFSTETRLHEKGCSVLEDGTRANSTLPKTDPVGILMGELMANGRLLWK